MRKLAFLAPLTILLAACSVDPTGIETTSTKTPRGNANASVTLTEYGDFQCPACKAAETAIVEPIMEQYGDRIAFEFKQFPLQSIHPYALAAAVASECAADQGKFWEYHDTVYVNQEQLSSESLKNWAEDLGLDMELFDRCTRSKIKRNIVQDEYAEGVDMDVRGTPTFFVNGTQVQTDVNAISQAIDAALSSGQMQL